MKEDVLLQIRRELGDDAITRDLDSGSALMTSGLLDSIATLRLVMYLEQTFSIAIQASELTVENFDTVDRIETFLHTKRAD